nr:mitogen-activated protein kinase kinase kinase 18-like [Quercus suber]POE83302.1 mitogen-activated protein kinase kinase kinase 3 [Quercus suber]
MAPECLIECVQEPPSDIWALGCVVCEMLTGKSPWDRGKEFNKRDLFNLIADERELPEIPTGVSSQAKDFLKACLVKKYMYRFTAEMLMDHPFLEGLGDEELPAVTCVSGTDEADYEVFCFSEDYELSCSSGDSSLLPDDGMALCFPPLQIDDLGKHLDGRSDENVPVLGQKRKRVTCYDNHICERAARRTLKCPASTIPAVGA